MQPAPDVCLRERRQQSERIWTATLSKKRKPPEVLIMIQTLSGDPFKLIQPTKHAIAPAAVAMPSRSSG
jgi:hypothetical protein